MLAVIPARGGSKGVKNKNIQKLNNKPLLFWSIERALESEKISEIIVSSDSKRILDIVHKTYDSRVQLHKRNDDLSQDNSKTIDLLQQLSLVKKSFQKIILLQPTSPLRKKNFIDKVISYHKKSKKQLTLSGFFSSSYPFGQYNNLPRQELEEKFYDDGSIYVFERELLIKGIWIPEQWNQYLNEFPYTLEIDTYNELELFNNIFDNYYTKV